jgi:hypothetical protein
MHGEPRGGNRRIVLLLLLAIGRTSPSWLAWKPEQPKERCIRANDAERAVFVCV